MEAFLRRVLPDGGNYVVAAIAGAAGARELRGLTSLTAAASAAQRLSTAPVNVFYAVGTYEHDRKAPLAKRCLFVDLDAKSFGTKQQALAELVRYCKAACFPPPTLYVDSGGGIHAYWTFDRDLPVEQWKPLAEALKASCLNAGFKIDPTVTADAARILRVPGTLNHKFSPPVPCRLMKDTGLDYDPAVLEAALKVSGKAQLSSSLQKLASMVGDNDLGVGPDFNAYPQVPYYATEIAEKCGIMKEAVETGGRDHSEPLWRHLMALLAFCDDGERLVHPISSGHPQYSEAQTNAKWDVVLKSKADGKIKPILCKTFATYKGSICAACPYNGRINTPMVLGKLEATTFLPYNYRMADYSIQKLAKKGDAAAGEPDVWRDVFHYRVTDVETFNHGEGRPLMVRAMYSSKKTVKRVDFSAALLASGQNEELNLVFANAHMSVGGNDLSEFKTIMTSWLRRMEDVKKAVEIDQNGLGWGRRGGHPAFAAGPNVFTPDGKQYDYTHDDKQSLKNFTPVGDITPWTHCATTLAKDTRQATVTTLLTAFAAPLVQFSDVNGLTFSLYSGPSGTGKSTALKTAQAVWGHPVLGIAQLDDTYNAVLHRLGFLNTLPAYWDELRGGELTGFIKLLFTLGQGREKARLTSNIKQQNTGTWDTLITIASNERIVDHVDQVVKNSDAGRLRVFEVVLPDLVYKEPAMGRSIKALETNYGHAGQIYAKYLVEHRADAENLVKQYVAAVRKGSSGTGERFWTAFVGVILAASVLVERAGLLTVDRALLQQYLLKQLAAQRHGVQQEFKTPMDAAVGSVFEFVASHRPNMLLVETLDGTGVSKYGNVLTPGNQMPREDIFILKAVTDKKLRIKRGAWRFWVQTHLKQSPTEFETALMSKGVLKKRGAMNAGIQAASNARVDVLEIDLASAAFAPYDDEQ